MQFFSCEARELTGAAFACGIHVSLLGLTDRNQRPCFSSKMWQRAWKDISCSSWKWFQIHFLLLQTKQGPKKLVHVIAFAVTLARHSIPKASRWLVFAPAWSFARESESVKQPEYLCTEDEARNPSKSQRCCLITIVNISATPLGQTLQHIVF